MGLLDSLKRWLGRGGHGSPPASEPQPPRRRDPDWATLPGGSSPKEASEVPEDRARELAD